MEATVHSLKDFDEIFISYGYLNITPEDEEDDPYYEIPYTIQSIYEILEFNDIPVQEDSSNNDRRCIKAFKYLLLNTEFECRNHLTRDPINGYLVGRWQCNMSPYFLTKILCHLGYEQILAESLLHIPLDLCIEILKMVKKNIFLLDFDRGLDLIIAIISNCHKNLIVAWKIGVQSMNFEDKCERLMIYTQKFMSFLISTKFLRLNEVKDLEKSERIGIILKKIIALTNKCLTNNENNSLPSEIAEHYKIVFGEDPLHKSKENFAPQLRMLNQEFMHILVKKLKEIDVECYDNWANLEADGNSSVSLQLSIRNDFYHFIEFLKIHKSFVHYELLVELMETFSPRPVNVVSTLNFDGLRYGSTEIKMNAIESVINRYSEWNHDTFDLIQRNRILLDLDDLPYLIDYLVLIMRKPGQQDHKARVCVAIRRVLFQLRVREACNKKTDAPPDIPEDDDLHECVDPAYSEDNFKTYIANNRDLKSPENLRTTLSFLLNNPCEVLEILIKVMIGVPDYANISIPPEDLIFFHPVIKFIDFVKLFTLRMRRIFTNSDNWDVKKLASLVNLMVNEFKITANDFVNCVFVHWLEKEPTDFSMFVSMLKFVQDSIVRKCTTDLKVDKLDWRFANRLTAFRTDLLLPRSVSDELIKEIGRTAKSFFVLLNESEENVYLLRKLQPIDRFKSPFSAIESGWFDRYEGEFLPYILSSFWDACLDGIERAQSRVIGGIAIDPNAPTNPDDFRHMEEDFTRYVLINFSQSEMIVFAKQMTEYLYEDDDYDTAVIFAFENILRLSIEAAMYFLEFPALNPPESFACLMRGLAGFIGLFSMCHLKEFNSSPSFDFGPSTSKLREIYGLYKCLRDNLLDLHDCVVHSTFYPLYMSLLDVVKDPSLDEEPRGVALYKIQTALEKFGNDCLKIPHSEVRFDRAPSAEALRFKKAHDFINECLNVDDLPTESASQYHSLCATFKLLSTQQTSDDS